MTPAPPVDNLRWDAKFPVLRLEGSGARDFLQGQTSADLSSSGDAFMHSCWLTASGRLRALLEIRFDQTGADVMVLAGDADSVQQGFDQVIFPADRVRLLGSQPQRRLQALSTPETDATSETSPSATSITWLDSADTLPEPWSQLPTVDADALERWRLEQGWPSGEGELSGDTNPFELGLSHWVSLSKGCYLGQETMAKLASTGGVKQQLRAWTCQSSLTPGTLLQCNGERAGRITSALPTPGQQHCIGLALVRRQYLDTNVLDGPGGEPLVLRRPLGFQDPPQAPGS